MVSDGRSPARLRQMAPRLAPLAPRVRALPREGPAFYRSAEWRKLVAARKLHADYFAALARAKDDGSTRVILDHVRALKDGGEALDPANTQWLTHREHQGKTARENARRAGGG